MTCPEGAPHAHSLAPDHEVRLDLRRSKIDPLDAFLVRAYLENWCGRNCRHDWDIEADDTHISMFLSPRDLFAFQLTEEFDFINRNN